MQRYSENQIRVLYSEFKSHKKYAAKLAFFDTHFGIIPFSFPEFDPHLRFFFQKDKTEELIEIFKKERNNPGLTERRFLLGETFVFNIKPANSNSAAYSNYILSRFLSRRPVFDSWIRRNKSTDTSIERLLEEANGTINKIEFCLQNEYDKSFRLQCMAVFFKGFYDAFSDGVTLPGKKRKFIELYLYAQGIIYSNYINFLKTNLRNSLIGIDLNSPTNLDLSGKLELLNELGIIEFLKTRYAGMDSILVENKIAEILCLVTGEYSAQKEAVIRTLALMNNRHADANRALLSSNFRQKIM
jgi:hypothetical protein